MLCVRCIISHSYTLLAQEKQVSYVIRYAAEHFFLLLLYIEILWYQVSDWIINAQHVTRDKSQWYALHQI